MARALRALGVVHGDRVVTWADTALELVPLFAACAKLGAVFAPVNARLGVREATAVAQIARPRLVIADAERASGRPRDRMRRTARALRRVREWRRRARRGRATGRRLGRQRARAP
jgi:acyl-coenzyme A synthetase/AMP-(fatty) acid ligase